MTILGISAFYHDSAAALVRDGRILAAAQEERFTRRKHDAGFPLLAAAACLAEAGVAARDIDVVVFYEKPFLKFERLLETSLAFAPRGFRQFAAAMPVWIREKLFQKRLLADALRGLDPEVDWTPRLRFSAHHLSHAASAFFPSPFREAGVLTADGVGEWVTTSTMRGSPDGLELLDEIRFPHSLGLLYSAFTAFCGFAVNDGEYKLMGLAPYGEPRHEALIRDHLIDLRPDGSFRLNLDFFDYCTGLRMTNRRFARLFGGPPRAMGAALTRREMDLAASIQKVLADAMLGLARHAREITGSRNLCLAGGVALNCVANSAVRRSGLFDDVWIQPAAGDAGGALGAALLAWHEGNGRTATRAHAGDAMQGAALGPSFSVEAMESALRAAGLAYERHAPEALVERCAELLDRGATMGWFQGRMEFGPRALGHRSILADPRRPEMQSDLNLRIKFRESFRPFAPAVPEEDAADWFDFDGASPYMLFTAPVAARRLRTPPPGSPAREGLERLQHIRSEIPAVTHVDDSARLQTVDAGSNPLFHQLLRVFKARTGCPVLVNTSFNVKDEPIVCSPEDAVRCYLATGLQALALGPFVSVKTGGARMEPAGKFRSAPLDKP